MTSAAVTPGVAVGSAASRAPLAFAGRTLAALVVLHTINDFYGLVVPPLLPVLRETFDLSYKQAGVVPFVATALSALLQPTLGYVADRRKKRRVFMAVGFVMFAGAMFVLSNASSYVTLLFAAAFLGFSASIYHPQSATMLAYYFRERRGWAQGIHGIGNGLGFMLAPLVVGYLLTVLGWREAVMVLALPALVAALLVGFTLREPDVRGGQGMLAGITRPLLLLMVVNGSAMGIGMGFVTWLPSLYNSQGYSLLAAGAFTAVMSSAALLAQPIGGTLSDRLGRRNLIVASLVGLGVFQLLFLAAAQLAASLPLMVLATVLVSFWSGLMPPVMMVYASEIAPGERTGMAVGIVWGLGTLIGSAAPLLTGALIDASGFGASYLALALLALGTAVLARGLPRSQQVRRELGTT